MGSVNSPGTNSVDAGVQAEACLQVVLVVYMQADRNQRYHTKPQA